MQELLMAATAILAGIAAFIVLRKRADSGCPS